MKRPINNLSAFCLLLLSFFSFQQVHSQSVWDQTFNTVEVAGSYSILEGIQTSDGGFVVSSGNGSTNGNANAFLMKLDPSGSLAWYKEYQGFHSMQAVLETSDGGLITAGRISGSNPYRNGLLKTDSNGNVSWSKEITVSGQGGPTGILETPSGYVLTFTSTYKVDLNGDSLYWGRFHVGGGGAAIRIKHTDQGFLTVGLGSYGNPADNYNTVITMLDTNGVVLWNKALGEDEYDWGHDGEETNDGGVIAAGWTRSFNDPLQESFLTKLDSAGGLLWTRTYGDSTLPTRAQGMVELPNGDFVFTGQFGTDLLLAKTDSAGTLLWSKTYGNGIGYSVSLATDGGFFIVAKETGDELKVVKTDSAGNSTCDEDVSLLQNDRLFLIGDNTFNSPTTPTDSNFVVVQDSSSPASTPCLPPVGLEAFPQSDFQVYPNPITGQGRMAVDLELPSATHLSTILVDANGRIVLSQKGEHTAGTAHFELDLRHIPSGIYFLNVSGNGKTWRKKIAVVE